MYKFEWSVKVPILFLVFRSFLKVYAPSQNEMQINRNSNCIKNQVSRISNSELLNILCPKGSAQGRCSFELVWHLCAFYFEQATSELIRASVLK